MNAPSIKIAQIVLCLTKWPPELKIGNFLTTSEPLTEIHNDLTDIVPTKKCTKGSAQLKKMAAIAKFQIFKRHLHNQLPKFKIVSQKCYTNVAANAKNRFVFNP